MAAFGRRHARRLGRGIAAALTPIYGTLIVGFTGGALIGAFASREWGAHAIWLAAGILAITLALFIVDQRVLR